MKFSRAAAVLGTAALLLATLFVQQGSADPAFRARLLVKGAGSTYTVSGGGYALATDGNPGVVVQSTQLYGTATFAIQIYSYTSGATTFHLSLDGVQDPADSYWGLPAVTTLSAKQGLVMKKLTPGPDGYAVTVPSNGAATLSLQVKSAVKAYGHAIVDLHLRAPDGTLLDTMRTVTEQRPTPGVNGTWLTVKQGSQAYVGDTGYTSDISAPALKRGGTTTFTIQVKNREKALSRRVSVWLLPGKATCSTIRLTDGKTDVTAQALGAGYQTPVLLPKLTHNLTATVTAGGNVDCQGSDNWVVAGGVQGVPLNFADKVRMYVGYIQAFGSAPPNG